MFRNGDGRIRVMRYPSFDGTQACAEVGVEFFFPENNNEAPGDYQKARSVCQRCDWQIECGDWALRHDSSYGMWGGMTPRERRTMRHRLGIINEPPRVHVPKPVSYET
jgi:WhiB family redox-sensing transcriptional regulator